MTVLAIAMNAEAEEKAVGLLLAMNFEMTAAGEPPLELLLVPAGEAVTGFDGRTWRNAEPQGVVDYFAARSIDIPVDIEHSTHHKAPKGDPAPAVAWVNGINARADGSVWGTVEWTDQGRELVKSKAYRYYSPAFLYDDTRAIRGIASVGLTNKPNLDVPALNQEGKEAPMDLKKLLAKLGLAETTTLAAALNAIGTLQGDLTTALNSAKTPSLDMFVPRGDYDAALTRATNAEQTLQTQQQAEFITAVNAEIDASVSAGKITPATKGFYLAGCADQTGLDRFREFAKAAPEIGKNSGLDGQDPNKGKPALNAEEKQVADMFGNSVEDIAKYGNN